MNWIWLAIVEGFAIWILLVLSIIQHIRYLEALERANLFRERFLKELSLNLWRASRS